MVSRIAIVMTLAGVVGCSDEPTVNITPTSPTASMQPLATPPPPPLPLPPPNFSEQDGDVYLYTSAVSEEEQKKGRAAGNVVGFKYLGKTDGLVRLAMLNDADRQTGTAECRMPCSIITYRYDSGDKDRVAFSPDSVIGSAFLDAFNGHLQVAKTKRIGSKPTKKLVEEASALDISADDEGPYLPVSEQ